MSFYRLCKKIFLIYSNFKFVFFFFVLFIVYFVFISMDLLLIKNVSGNENPIVQLSVYPNAGISASNIEVRCEISLPPTISSLSSSKFDNVYLSVQTDSVKPSGILLMYEDSTDRCRVNRDNVQLDVCNSSLILIHINHTILNDTLQKIDYSCKKGSIYAFTQYQLLSMKKKFEFFFLFF